MTNEYREPPDLSGKKLDFSQFHPTGDHWPWQCGDLYGGWRQHLRNAWEYRWSESLRQHTICLIGFHRRVTMFANTNPKIDKPAWCQVVCHDCGKPLSNRQPV